MPWAQGVGRSNRPAPTKENKLFICNAGFRPGGAPVASCGVLEAPSSYNFDYSAPGSTQPSTLHFQDSSQAHSHLLSNCVDPSLPHARGGRGRTLRQQEKCEAVKSAIAPE